MEDILANWATCLLMQKRNYYIYRHFSDKHYIYSLKQMEYRTIEWFGLEGTFRDDLVHILIAVELATVYWN